MEFNKPFYQYELSEDALRFDFYSVSESKRIHKVVQYSPIPDNEAIFQLSFGDLNTDETLDFITVSNNQDMNLILATVVQTIFKFFELKPDKSIVFIGSTATRTRLYRIIISKLLIDIEPFFNIIGILENGSQEAFIKNQNYLAYLISLKDEK